MSKPKLLLAAAVIFGVGAGAFVFLAGGSRHPSDLARIDPKVEIAPGTSAPGPAASANLPAVPISRLVVPGLGIDAATVVLGVDSDGVMQAPDGPADVGWYDFSSLPGQGKNVVVSGHVDYVRYGPAVFWRLHELHDGDVVQLLLEDQSVATYRVVSTRDYDSDKAPVQEIIGPTEVETLTLITCGGSFNTKTREYDKRLVVRAIRS